MPSALETLVKILKLERERGCQNSAVIGGLGAYSTHWQRQAIDQARRPEQIVLAEELSAIMRQYDALDKKEERLKQIIYMLDRVTGRAPIPASYAARLQEVQANFTPPEAKSEASPKGETSSAPPKRRDDARPEARPRERERGERGNRPPVSAPPPSDVPVEAEAKAPEAPAKRERPERDKRREDKRERPEGRTEQKRTERPAPTEKRREDKRERPVKPTSPARLPSDDADDDEGINAPEFANDAERFNRDEDFYTRPVKGAGQLDVKPLPRLARPPRTRRKAQNLSDAKAALHELDRDIKKIKGIGDKLAEAYQALGIQSLYDLLYYLPRRYDDYTRLKMIARLQVGEVQTVIGKVVRTDVRLGKGGRKDFIMVLDDGTARLTVNFFGQHYLARTIQTGKQYVVSGKVGIFRDTFQMSNPEWEALDTENLHAIGIVPVYALNENIKPRSFRKTMKTVVEEWADKLPDYVPLSTLERTDLADLGWMVKQLHFPEGFDHLEHAQRRHIFDQLFLLQLAILGNRRDWQSARAYPLVVDDDFLEPFTQSVFPYPLTNAQWRAIRDIQQDVSRDIPMNRLVQGDVGSGKTAVALTAMGMALANGKQAALMAPTSILAEQHYRNMARLFEVYPGERKPVVALLTSALSTSERESIYRGIADASIDVVIGTHALIQEGVNFKDLAVAVVDEQHRFGVQQRAALRGKGTNPHLLVMTATPIPRTLALTMYADLDLSIIDEKPAGRQPIITRILLPVERERALSFVETQLAQGRQAFIVHPLVEMSDKIETRSAIEAFEELQQVFYKYRVCLLHGRMKPSEKDDVMAAFARHDYDVMVTTSVAEVGVDVPNASVMVIEGANRFGLAQLHQFRGRVGRGEHASYCILIPDEDIFTPEILSPADGESVAYSVPQQRLKALEQTEDGFRLAELDWRLRGAGDLLGLRQSGAHLLQLAEQMTPEIVALAQREARTLYEDDPDLLGEDVALLAERVAMLRNAAGDVS